MTIIFWQKAGVADEATEDGIGHSGHRRKNGRRRDAHAADLDGLRYRRGLSGAAGNRSVPVLAHRNYCSWIRALLRVRSVGRALCLKEAMAPLKPCPSESK